jgi:hypothetical protein
MNCTHCGAPNVQPGGHCTTCGQPAAPQTMWADATAPSGLFPPATQEPAPTPPQHIAPQQQHSTPQQHADPQQQ